MFNGAAPTQAVLLLDRLRLFPVVFAAPPQNEKQLGQAYGGACASAVAAAEALLKASRKEGEVRLVCCRGWVGWEWGVVLDRLMLDDQLLALTTATRFVLSIHHHSYTIINTPSSLPLTPPNQTHALINLTSSPSRSAASCCWPAASSPCATP